MTPAEFKRLGARLYDGAHGWQTALARALDVPSRKVRKWIAGEADVPDGVAQQLRAAVAALGDGPGVPIDSAPPPGIAQPPEWIVGVDAHDGRDDAPEYIVHTRRPRFIAAVIDEDEAGLSLSPRVFAHAGMALADIAWLDGEPDGSWDSDEAKRWYALALEAV